MEVLSHHAIRLKLIGYCINVLPLKKEHYTTIKGSIQQENFMIFNTYVANIAALKYIKQMLIDIKGENNSNTRREGNTPLTLSGMDRSFRQKTNKETVASNNPGD